MENEYIEESVRERLILSGLAELQEHGLTDFSLRRAALAAQVSCAAPYRHFKDKEAYIAAILAYVQAQWELLCHEIERIFSRDVRLLCIELCMAALRFRIADPHVRSVFSLSQGGVADAFDAAVVCAAEQYAASRGLSEADTRQQVFLARALIAGSMALTADADKVDEVLACMRHQLELAFV